MEMPPEQMINNWRIKRKRGTTELIEYKNKEKKCWMTNNKIDTEDQLKIIPNNVHGNVLVLGLGLGIVVEMLAKYKAVKHIIVIEQSHEVINMVWQYVEHDNKAKVVKMNDIDYIKSNSIQFDYVLADTYNDYSDITINTIINPLKQTTKKYLPFAQFVCWKPRV